ncbi:MAG: T9SS type A sorting domain-containing protein [Bacteroidales bacterium]|nr:T9SS type A sorting domain-containing protein [Bacteroidales bacterium]
MKRIFLLFFFLGTFFSINAQSIQLKDHDGNNITNTVVNYSDIASATLKYNILISNVGSGRIGVMFKKIEVDILEGSTNSFCFAGSCYPPFSYVSSDALNIEEGETSAYGDCYGEYSTNGIVGQSTITYVVFASGNENDSAYVTVNYQTTPVSVPNFQSQEKISFSNAWPNPATSTTSFNYQLPSDGGLFILRSITGAVIKEEHISGLQGRYTLNVSDLPEGIYIYSVIADQKVVTTKKLVVKK